MAHHVRDERPTVLASRTHVPGRSLARRHETSPGDLRIKPPLLYIMRSILRSCGIAALLLTTATHGQGPTLVRDFWTGSFGAYINHGRPSAMRLHGDDLLLFANDGPTAAKLFRLSDLSGNMEELAAVGTAAGYTTTNGGIITSGNNIYFFSQETGSTNFLLWCVRDGAAAEQLAVLPYSLLFYYAGIPLPDGKLLFPGHDDDHGFELWVTDGTTAGTSRVKDINPGTSTSFGSPFPAFQGFDFNGKAYFLANDGTNGPQLWTSDGTEAGTVQFATINPANTSGAVTMLWSKNDDKFIVTGNTGLLGSDGTIAGTSVIHTGEYAWAHIPGLNYHTADNGYMYFSALENSDWKLYRTMGTQASTQLVIEDVVPNQGYPYMTELNGMLYTFTMNGDQNTQLVRIDPSTHTATVVRTFLPGSQQSMNGIANFYGFRNDGQYFYFMGRADESALQYWRSDGTEAGTVMITGFTPDVINGGPNGVDGNMIVFNGQLVFSGNDATVGAELWTAQGPVGIEAQEARPVPVKAWSHGPSQFTVQSFVGGIRHVVMFDANGTMVSRYTGNNAMILHLGHNQAPGLYTLRVATTSGTYTARLMLL